MKELIEMDLVRIRIDEHRGEQVIVLKEKDGERLLPIVIGIIEASAIKMKVSGFNSPRPLTHDLLNNIIRRLKGRLDKIVVERLENSIFYAKIIIEREDGEVIEIDARPSDSVALALRAEVPIFAEDALLRQIETK
ncbi:MAG: bifunctional nuclease family protein [Candidatus Kaelpia aquatica]|nr:bifunctional nuclease family protein [Candidatus Kaelpia aquatica]